jgi:YggT family protein
MAALFLQLLSVLKWIIIIDSLLSWVVPNNDQFPRSITSQLADPLCAPFRKLLSPERTGGLDLSPLAAILVLSAMHELVSSALFHL